MLRVAAFSLLVCLFSAPGQAIVVRHDRDEQDFLNLGKHFPSTVTLRRADGRSGLGDEGTLIAARWVLTAAHVATELGPGDLVEIHGKIHRIKRVVCQPDWHKDADMQTDIALVQLATPVTDVVPARPYSGTDEEGMIATFVGRGGIGTGLTGPLTEDRRIRAATNRVESTRDVFPAIAKHAEGSQLRFRFDAPGDPHVTLLEGISGPGDSGGPAYIKRRGVLYVIGVSSGQDNRPTNHQQGRYGVFEYYVRVSHFSDWIHRVIGTAM
jgi:Trypsin